MRSSTPCVLQLAVLLSPLIFGLTACKAPERSDALSSELRGEDEATVRARLGEPLEVRHLDTTAAPPKATDAEKAAWRAETHETTWAYPGLDIDFSVDGRVLRVVPSRLPPP